MFYRKSSLCELINPQGLFCGLALRAVPVTATIVTVAYLCATGAHFFVPAQRSCAALHYVKQGFGLLWGQLFLFN